MSSSLHALSVFKNSCRSAPITMSSNSRNRPTTAPSANSSSSLPDLSDTIKGRPKTAGPGGDDWSGPAVPKPNHVIKTSSPPSPPVPPTETGVKQPGGENYATLFQTLLDSNSLLHKEINKLRRDHKKAMSRLTDFRDDRKSARQGRDTDERCMRCQSSRAKEDKSSRRNRPQAYVKDYWESGSETHLDKSQKGSGNRKSPKYDTDKSSVSEECYEPSVMYDTPEEFHFDSSADSDKLSIKSIESYQITYISSSSSSSPQNLSTCSSLYGSPQMLVGKMWEGFSVGDYPVEDFSEAFPNKEGMDGRKQWTPKVTVPEPFSMTVREASTIKKKTRSMVIAEKEQEGRDALFDAKSRRKFRATPIPANTYLPLYNLINAKNEQRKELVKKMSGNLLKSSQRPFKFSKRDEEKKQQKSEWLKQAQEEEISRFKEKMFKAKPIPPRLLNQSVEEEIEEKEEYRKIRSRVRAEQLLAKSKAPYSMRLQSHANIKLPPPPKLRPGKSHPGYSARSGFTFQPKVTHKVPDYKKTYARLQQQLLLKKQSKLTTVSEPFNLHTEKRAKTRQPVEATNTQSDSGIEDRLDKVPPPPSDAPPYAPVMTETARRRRLLTQERLEEAVLKGAAEEDQLKVRKKRQKDFQKIVAKKTSAFDLGELLEEKKKLKMEEFR